MKKLKMILPMLAFVLAIGLSFANVKDNNTVQTGYVYDSGIWTMINSPCEGNGYTCKIRFVDGNGNPLSDELDVYPIPAFKDDEGNTVVPLKSSSPNAVDIQI